MNCKWETDSYTPPALFSPVLVSTLPVHGVLLTCLYHTSACTSVHACLAKAYFPFPPRVRSHFFQVDFLDLQSWVSPSCTLCFSDRSTYLEIMEPILICLGLHQSVILRPKFRSSTVETSVFLNMVNILVPPIASCHHPLLPNILFAHEPCVPSVGCYSHHIKGQYRKYHKI